MITVYASEQRGGHITITTDKDALPSDVIRTSTRIFPDHDSILGCAEAYWLRGYSVTIDTDRGIVEYEQ